MWWMHDSNVHKLETLKIKMWRMHDSNIHKLYVPNTMKKLDPFVLNSAQI